LSESDGVERSISTHALLKQLDIRPSKGLGQNFLVDESVPPKILAAAELDPNDAVVEIGPGIGVLTQRLAANARKFTAVELDKRLYPHLRQMLSGYSSARLVEGNVLGFEPEELEPEPYKLIANIPYYITSAILRHFLESAHRPTRLVLMIQKEVGQRIVAKPPDMSLLAVSVQFYGRPKMYALVKAGAFFPPPKVDSTILVVDTYKEDERACRVENESRFFEIVRAGFGQKRKQLGNSLASGLKIDKEKVSMLLSKAGIQSERRAESLSLEEWGRLYQSFMNMEHYAKIG
jgi:16S rRNA (adenine1518-N6/adenine1519-N6)-dimethyltransferase